MLKLLAFNVIISVSCALYWNYSEHGNIGLDWGFLEPRTQIFEN